MVDLAANGLPQTMHSNGSSSFRTISRRDSSVKLKRGSRVMTDSGQVFRHRPHWTQACSVKRSIGASGLSVSAPVGQAPTQDMQSVQPSASICTAPKAAPAGSASSSTGVGAWRCRCSSAMADNVRLPPMGRKSAAGIPDGGSRP